MILVAESFKKIKKLTRIEQATLTSLNPFIMTQLILTGRGNSCSKAARMPFITDEKLFGRLVMNSSFEEKRRSVV